MNGVPHRALVIANGKLANIALTKQRLDEWLVASQQPLIVAADGGAHNAIALSLLPSVVVGDLDSLDDSIREWLEETGCRFEIAPIRKDETDLELALRMVAAEGRREVWVAGALGGRLDQTIANILLLSLPFLDGIDVRIVDGAQTAWLVKDETLIRGAAGDTVSLIPAGGDAHGITTEGLDYPLDNDRLPFGPSLGISNALISQDARVTLAEGLLLVIHTSGET